MNKIITTKKGTYDVWVDLSNLPYQPNGKYINYSVFKDMGYVEVPFEYKGLKDTIKIAYHSSVPNHTAKVNFNGETTIMTLQSIRDCSLEKVTYNKRKELGLIKRFSGSRKVSLDNILELPESEYYKVSRMIVKKDFKNSIGKTIPYVFNDIQGELTLTYYFVKNINGEDKYYVRVKENDVEYLYNLFNILIGNLERVAKPFKYPYDIGDTVGKFTVIDHIMEDSITSKGTVDVERYLKLKCNDCGMIKRVTVSHINENSREYCADCSSMKKAQEKLNIVRSRGESMLENVLKQQDIEYTPEKSFEWSNGKRYDFYLPTYKGGTVVEVHGVQHYLEQGKGQRFHLTLEENKKNDKWKKEMAIENGLHYIEIDVRNPDFEFIKESIEKSEIPSDVDWKIVIKNSDKGTLVDDIMRLHKEGYTIKEIAKEVKLNVNTVSRRVNVLTKFGLLDHTPYDYQIKQIKEKLSRMEKQREEYLRELRG